VTRGRDYTDIIGGAVLLLFGAWFFRYATAHYAIGELRRMGPGFFPAALGLLVAGFGALLLLTALFRRGALPRPAPRPVVAILAGGLAFTYLVEPLGLVPATVALVGFAALAERRVRPLRTAILAVALSALAVTVFSWGLGIPVPAFRWQP
jgi:hypothetical protein